MPDLLASASLLPLTPAIAPRMGSVAVPVVADFMAMLGDLVLPPGAKLQGGKGQALAGDGKDLPVGNDVAADGEDADDPVIAWLPAGLAPLTPVDPAPLPDVAPVAAPAAAAETGFAAPPAGEAIMVAALPEATVSQPASMPVVETAAAASVSDGPTTIGPEQVVPADGEIAQPEMPVPSTGIEQEVKPEIATRERLPRPVVAPMATPLPVVPGTPVAQTAGQVFAAAISASFDAPAATRPADPVAVQTQAAASEQLRTTVQAMSGAEQAPLDLSRDDWTGKMIDRIAMLRDAAEAADTRIRLAPENLGNVDVSIRRDGDRLHVHFAAENPVARQLIAEAAPRLAELADARGVKLGQTSVDGGTGGQQQGASNQPQSNQPARPASAMAHQSQSDRDDRVA
jgi:flagellar hook-length control protein FliK